MKGNNFIGYTCGYTDGQPDDKIGEEIFRTKKEADSCRAKMEKPTKWEREHEGAKCAVVLAMYETEWERDEEGGKVVMVKKTWAVEE